ncbi:MAG: hypothetical protein KKB21_04360 [Nanoarchaeota archaeon]|nr:hypothetical protein [Nanoarchaeota archaeon]
MAQDKKKWFDVEIPLLRMKIKLIAYSIEELDNRTVKLDLTRILRGKSLEAIVKIKVKDEKAEGEVSELNLLGFFIRRMMRNNISYVEDSLSLDCLDSVMRIKPFLITRKKVTRAVRKALRDAAKKYLEDYAKESTSEDIFQDIASNKIQKNLSGKLKKVYPLALCEIRMSKIEKIKEGVSIEKTRIKKAKPEEIEEKSQIEEIEEELEKKKGEKVEELEEKTQAEELEEKKAE